jgi:hypothetical protein
VIKLRCEDFDELIYLFWDGRIDQRKKEELEKHLSTCKRCKEKLALLESIEKGAKGIKIKEPSKEYWDTFSSRVRERIIAQKEEAFSYRLKKVFENVFTFSPLKVKIAVGVVSIVLVFIVGKLYMDYQGKEIIPSRPKVESTKEPASYAPELKKEVTRLEEKVKKKEKVPPPHDELEKVVAPQIIPKEKTTPVTSLEEKVREKDEVTPPPGELEKAVAPQIIPEEETITEVVESKEEILSPETYTTGAGAKEKGRMLEEAVPPEHKIKDIEEAPFKGKTMTAARKPLALDRAMETASVRNYYVMDDTLLQEDVLRKTIESWNRYIEKNPSDSLANIGYLQVAIGYYLLSKLTQEESDLLEGIELLEKYQKQITDPKTKKELNKKLKQLKALKEKFSPK